MSLGILSFDLAALINSLSNCFETVETQNAPLETTLENIENVLQSAAAPESVIAAGLTVAAGLENSVTPLIAAAAAENPLKAPSVKNTPAVRTATAKFSDDARKEIERLIKSLQTSVIHNYKSTDIIDEAVSHELISKFAKRKIREDSDEKKEARRQQKKIDERRLEALREELKKTIKKYNSKV